jgi:autotransporter-associated beta strand protein
MKTPILSLSASIVTFVVASQAAMAANGTDTWQGSSGSTDWATGGGSGNWTTSSINKPPISGDSLVFGTTNLSTTATLTNSLTTSAFNINGITFNASAPAYTMTGNTFNLTGGIANNSGNLQTFSNTGGLTQSTSFTDTVTSAGGITITNGLTDTGAAGLTTTVTGVGGLLTLGSFTLNSGAAAAVTDTFAGTGNVSITGSVSNGSAFANGLTYSGSGTLTLGGSNSYSGLTTVGGGVVVLSGSNTSTGATTVTSGTLQLNSANNGGLAAGTLTLNGGTVQSLLASQAVTNTVTLAASSTISGANSISLTGTFSQSAASTLTNNISGATNTLTLGGVVNIDAVTGTALTLTLAGTGNTLLSGVIEDYSSGVGTSHGALSITNTGNTTLSNANTFGGGITLNNGTGTLEIQNAAALGTGAFSITGGNFDNNSAGPLTMTNNNLVKVTNSFGYGGTQNLNFGTGTVSFSGQSPTITVSSNTLTFGGVVLNSGTPFGITKNGAGTLNFTNTTVSTSTTNLLGAVTVNGGAVELSNTGLLAKSTVTLNTNSGLIFNSGTGTFSVLSLNGSGNLTLQDTASSPVTVILSNFTGNSNGTYSGVLSGTGGITRIASVQYNNASGVQTFTGPNTFTGTTTINGGIINYQNGTALGTYSPIVVTTSSGGGGAVQIQGGIAGGSDTLTLAGSGVEYGGNGALENVSGNNSYAGNIVLTASSTIQSDAGALYLAGNVTNSASSGTVTLTLQGASTGTNTINGVISDGSPAITALAKSGAGTWILANNNTYSGGTSITGGTLQMNSNTALGTTGTVTVGAAGTIGFGTSLGGAASIGNLAGAGNIVLQDTGSNAVTLTVNSSTGTTTYSGVMSGSGGLTEAGPGALILSGSDSFSGATSVTGGTINYQNGTAFGTNSAITVSSGAGVQVQGGITGGSQTLTLSGAGATSNGALENVSGNNSYAGNIVISGSTFIGSDSGSLTLLGGISGSGFLKPTGVGTVIIDGAITTTGALQKNNTGTLVLAGANTYAGATTFSNTSAGAIEYLNGTAFGTNSTITEATWSSGVGNTIQVAGGITGGTDAMTLSGPGSAGSTGALENISGSNSYGGAITINAATTITADSGTLTLTGGLSPVASGNSLTFTGAGNIDFTTTGISGGMTVTKSGAGTLVLAAGNTFSAGITLNNGTIDLQAPTGTLSGTNALTFGNGGTPTFEFDGTGASAAIAQTMGALTPSSTGGEGTVESYMGGATTATLTFSSLGSRTAGGTLNFVTVGGTNGAAGVPGTNVINFTTSPGTGFINAGTFFNGSNYAFYDTAGSTKFLRGINYGVDPSSALSTGGTTLASSFTGTLGATSNVEITGTITADTTGTLKTLQIAGAYNYTQAASTNTLTVGGLLKSGGGAATISGGALTTGGSSDLVVRAASATDTLTIGDPITSTTTGGLTTSGLGTVILTGANTYTGGADINGGTLQIGNGGSTGNISAAGNVLDNGLLVYDNTTGATLSGNLTGPGALTVAAGKLVLSGGTLSYSGQTTINSGGTLQVGNNTAGNISTSNNIIDNGTLAYDVSSSFTYSGIVSGSGGLTVMANILTLTGADSYTGTTTVNAGTGLTFGTGGNLTGAGPIVDNGTISAASAGTVTLLGTISGTGTLSQSSGTLYLGSVNSYSSGGNLSGGTTVVGANSALGTGTYTISNTIQTDGNSRTLPNAVTSSALTFGNGGNLTLTGTITDSTSGVFNFKNAESTTLGQVNLTTAGKTLTLEPSYGGGFTAVGSIQATGSASIGIIYNAVASTVDLTGSNTLGSGVTLSGGASGYLMIGNDNALGGQTFAFNSSNGNPYQIILLEAAPTSSEALSVGGLTGQKITSGGISVTTDAGLAGSNNLEFDISMAGTSLYNQSSGAVIFTAATPSGISGNGTGSVILSPTSTSATFGWADGSGTLTASGTNTGSLTLTGGSAILDTGNTNVHATGTLVLSGANLALENVSSTTSNVNQTVASTVLNAGQSYVSQVSSTGTLIMGALTESGVTSGSGSSGAPGTIAGSGDLNLASSNIATTTTGTTNGVLLPGEVTVGGQNTAYFAALSGTSIIAHTSGTTFPGGATGSVTLNYFLNDSGSTTGAFNAQTLQLSSDTSGQSLTLGGALTFNGNGAGLLYDGSNGYTITGSSIGNANGVLTVQQWGTGTLTIASGIGSSTTTFFVKAGPGTLALSGTSDSYTGLTLINSGVLAISSDSNLNPVVTGTLNNPATSNTASSSVQLANQGVPAASGFSVGANLLGQQVVGINNSANGLFLSGNANAVVSNTNLTYINDPGIVLEGGTLQATTSFTLGSQVGGTGPVYGRSIMLATQNGTIDVTAGNTLTVPGIIYGGGSLTKVDSGTLLLTNANNNYTGGTTVTGGTLAFGVSNSLNNTTVAGILQEALINPVLVNGGSIDLLGTTQDFGPVTLASGSILDSTGGGLVNAYSYTLQSGTVSAILGDAAARNSASGTALNASLTKSTNGTVVLTGNNVYSGATLISGGVLQVGNGGTTGALGATSNVSMTGGTLAFDRSDSVTYGNVISGAGNLTQMGSGTLTLTGSNGFTGTLAVNAGTLAFGTVSTGTVNAQPIGDGTLITLGVGSGTSGLLAYTGTGGTLDKNVTALGSGANTIRNSGSGQLTLTGTLTKTDTALVLNGGTSGILVTGVITNAAGSNSNFDSDLYATGSVTVDNSNNNYSGATHVYGGGTLVNGLSGALPSSTVVELGNSDAIAAESGQAYTNTYVLNGYNQTVAGLTSTSTASYTDTNSVVGGSATTSTLTVAPTGTDTYAGVLGGSGTNQNNLVLVAAGTGTLILTGADTYTGPTKVTSGALYANNTSGSATGSGAVSVSNGAIFGGSGSIAPTATLTSGSAITVADGGNISPGGIQPAVSYNHTANGGLGPNNPANGNLTINSTGVTAGTLLSVGAGTVTKPSLTFALGAAVSGNTATPDSSQIVVTGGNANTINFAANGTGNSIVAINDVVGASLQLNLAYALIVGNNTTFEDNGAAWLNSSSTGLAAWSGTLPSNLTGNTVYQITGGLALLPANTSGNFFSQWYPGSVLLYDQTTDSIEVEVVPEPSTWAMILGGMATLLFWQRRRQQNKK